MRVIINSPFQATWSERDVKMLKASGYDHHVFHGFANGLLIGAWGILKLMFNRSSRGAVWLHQSAGHASVIPCVFGQFFGQKNIVIAVGADCACVFLDAPVGEGDVLGDDDVLCTDPLGNPVIGHIGAVTYDNLGD